MKTKSYISVVIEFLLLSAVSMATSYGGGSGTAEDPYQIWTAEQLIDIGLNSVGLRQVFCPDGGSGSDGRRALRRP